MYSKSEKMSIESWFLYLLLLVVSLSNAATSQSIKTLPGYPGPLPFKLETGYISVGEKDEVQLFYYFIESERDPDRDPLMLWLTGGPGCSGFSDLVYEFGPLAFDLENFDGSFPSLILNPHSWTKIANIIFIDSPVGTGFSYATKSEAYPSSDSISAKYTYAFLRQWLSIHPKFLKNRLYIGGDSYGGKIVPIVALQIAQGNEDGLKPRMSLQGYITGNAFTDMNKDKNQVIPYAHRMALISDEYFELAKNSCKGEYVNPDPYNVLCLYALQFIKQSINNINRDHILEPICTKVTPKEDEVDFLLLPKEEELWCRYNNYLASQVWANNQTVQEALHVIKGTKSNWVRCNRSISYVGDVESVFQHLQNLSDKGYQALAYSGDHDMTVPYMSTLNWIRELNLTIDDSWRAWTVDGQVAGYTEKYSNKRTYLTFATVKGAGHTAPEYKPKECFQMIKRWLSSYPL